MPASQPPFYPYRYLTPRFWPTWLLFGGLWLASRLPLPQQLRLGRWLGDTLYRLHRKRRAIVRINLDLCFPEKTTDEKRALAREAFRCFGMSVFEMASLWFRPPGFLLRHCTIEGIQHLQTARKNGVGVILLQAHFTTLELGANLIACKMPMDANYDPPRNPLFAAFLLNRRNTCFENMIDNRSIRHMVRRLREGACVWYSPDQHVGFNSGGMATTFFAQKVLTANAAARMAKLTGARVIPYLPTRIGTGCRYRLQIFPPLAHFPGTSLIDDTQRINDTFEAHIRQHPEQYFWLHKRFKRFDTSRGDWYT